MFAQGFNQIILPEIVPTIPGGILILFRESKSLMHVFCTDALKGRDLV